GTSRHVRNAVCARSTAVRASSAVCWRTRASTLPSMGERAARSPLCSDVPNDESRESMFMARFCSGFDTSTDGFHLARLLISHAEAVGEEGRQLDLLLADEAALRQLAFAEQVHGSADTGGGGDLYRRLRRRFTAVGKDL